METARNPRITDGTPVFVANVVPLRVVAESAAIARGPRLRPLTPEQLETLAQCEVEIRESLRGFLTLGAALFKVQKGHLYSATHATFEDYCRERWQISSGHAYRLIAAAQVVEALLPIGNTPLPSNESQVRPLLEVDRDLVPAVWKRVVANAGDQPITAKLVREAVKEIVPRSDPMQQRRRRCRSTTNLGDLLYWIEKAKLFVERGYQQDALNALDVIQQSIAGMAAGKAARKVSEVAPGHVAQALP